MTTRAKPKYHRKPTWHQHDYEHEYPYSPTPYYWEWYELPEEESDEYYRMAAKPTPKPKPKPKLGGTPTPHAWTGGTKLAYYDEYDMATLEAYQCGFKDGFDTALMLVQNGTIPMPPAPTPEPTPSPTEVTTG